MFVSVSSVMSSVADFSHLFLVSLVVLLFGILIVFIKKNIFWLHGEDFLADEGPSMNRQKIEETEVVKIDIPFYLKLDESCVDDTEVVTCDIYSNVESKVFVYWGVSIPSMHNLLRKPWNDVKSAEASQFLAGNSNFEFEHTDVFECSLGKETHAFVRPNNLNLGPPPRDKYPLVVIIAREDIQPCSIFDSVALVNVIHVKDDVCPEPSSIIARYTKLASGHLTVFKTLYLAAGNDSEETSELDNAKAGKELCVVCLANPLSVALLPCGHTCVCHSCFPKLEFCPLCRGRISTFFAIRKDGTPK